MPIWWRRYRRISRWFGNNFWYSPGAIRVFDSPEFVPD
jgi:hypothetical protein